MKLNLLFLLLIPVICSGQLKKGNTYISGILHDLKQPGASFVTSFNLHPNIGLGAGVDISSYNKSIIAPAYLDCRVKQSIGALTPFLVGQFGYPIYNRTEGTGVYVTDVNGGNKRELMDKVSGLMTYSGGIGLSYELGKVGIFISGMFRAYRFKNKIDMPGGSTTSSNTSKSVGVINLGIVF